MHLKYISYFEIIYGGCYLLSYFLNILNKNGKKFKSEKHIYQAFILINLKIRENPYLFFFEIIEKTKPVLFTKFKKESYWQNIIEDGQIIRQGNNLVMNAKTWHECRMKLAL